MRTIKEYNDNKITISYDRYPDLTFTVYKLQSGRFKLLSVKNNTQHERFSVTFEQDRYWLDHDSFSGDAIAIASVTNFIDIVKYILQQAKIRSSFDE